MEFERHPLPRSRAPRSEETSTRLRPVDIETIIAPGQSRSSAGSRRQTPHAAREGQPVRTIAGDLPPTQRGLLRPGLHPPVIVVVRVEMRRMMRPAWVDYPAAPSHITSMALSKKKATTIALDPEADQLLTRAARERGVSRSEFIRQQLALVLEQYRRHPKPRSAGIIRSLSERGNERELFGGRR